MLLKDALDIPFYVPDNPRLQQAISVGAVRIDSVDEMRATIIAPAQLDSLTDDEILLVLRAASEIGKTLENLGFKVAY